MTEEAPLIVVTRSGVAALIDVTRRSTAPLRGVARPHFRREMGDPRFLSSLGIIIYLALPRDRAETHTTQWKAWIEEHARAIIVIVAAAIGIFLVQAALTGLHS